MQPGYWFFSRLWLSDSSTCQELLEEQICGSEPLCSSVVILHPVVGCLCTPTDQPLCTQCGRHLSQDSRHLVPSLFFHTKRPFAPQELDSFIPLVHFITYFLLPWTGLFGDANNTKHAHMAATAPYIKKLIVSLTLRSSLESPSQDPSACLEDTHSVYGPGILFCAELIQVS